VALKRFCKSFTGLGCSAGCLIYSFSSSSAGFVLALAELARFSVKKPSRHLMNAV
jgi:hypothetical protein